ncbi:hypothetical protein AAFF_G00036580 [Aldrovandia affinis]|uniref:Uncharacterized protein n=1 Tax=Aldrovandia affinis TaxID=143900 RepID=A0AAD7WFL2_9TELE|nr:hypothetical protein AAFF_G00036580 [Aldrovandia affinis]
MSRRHVSISEPPQPLGPLGRSSLESRSRPTAAPTLTRGDRLKKKRETGQRGAPEGSRQGTIRPRAAVTAPALNRDARRSQSHRTVACSMRLFCHVTKGDLSGDSSQQHDVQDSPRI